MPGGRFRRPAARWSVAATADGRMGMRPREGGAGMIGAGTTERHEMRESWFHAHH